MHTLKPAPGAKHRRKRIGRGNASGHGTYSTRGQKGQRSRSGGRGGLKLLGMRHMILSTPKLRGFRSQHPRAHTVNLEMLDKRFEDGSVVTQDSLVQSGLIDLGERVKLLSDGALKKKLTIKGIPVSAQAREKIIAAGGSVE